MKIAWFSPFARHGSGIAVYSGSVVGEMAKDHQVVVYAPDLADVRHGACRNDVPIISLQKSDSRRLLRELKEFDHVFYNLGDNITYHREIYDTLRAHPGVVVLHDLVMRDFFAGYYLTGGRIDIDGLLTLVDSCHGAPGRDWMQGILEGRIDPENDPFQLEYHMAEPAIRSALSVVVHSDYARGRVVECSKIPIAHVDFPAPALTESLLGRTSETLRTSQRPIRVLTFGHVVPNKQVHTVLSAIAASEFLRSNIRYTVIGNIGNLDYKARLERLIIDLDLTAVVDLAGAKNDEVLHAAIREADVVVNLRNPHYGESSWSLLETLFAAKPTIVWNHGYYAEFPGHVVHKVSDTTGLTTTLEDLCSNPDLRRALGNAARAHAVHQFDTAKYCREILAFAESEGALRVVARATDRLARTIAEMTDGPGATPLIHKLTHEFLRFLDDSPPKSRVAVTQEPARR